MEKELFGLILAGGKSTRMGSDKGLLLYYDKPQRDYLFELASQFCDKVFYSVREEQITNLKANSPLIVDQNQYKGPFNGILSAHNKHPDTSWLVLACDLPFLDAAALSELIAARDSSKTATAFSKKTSNLPEPLIAIWEAKGLKQAKKHMDSAESTCPRKFLINSNCKLVVPKNEEVLYNANSLKDYETAKAKI